MEINFNEQLLFSKYLNHGYTLIKIKIFKKFPKCFNYEFFMTFVVDYE